MVDMKTVADVAYNLQHHLSDDGHIKRVSKESRKLVADSMAKLNISPEAHAEAMLAIQGLVREYPKRETPEQEREAQNGSSGIEKAGTGAKQVKSSQQVDKRKSKPAAGNSKSKARARKRK